MQADVRVLLGLFIVVEFRELGFGAQEFQNFNLDRTVELEDLFTSKHCLGVCSVAQYPRLETPVRERRYVVPGHTDRFPASFQEHAQEEDNTQTSSQLSLTVKAIPPISLYGKAVSLLTDLVQELITSGFSFPSLNPLPLVNSRTPDST